MESWIRVGENNLQCGTKMRVASWVWRQFLINALFAHVTIDLREEGSFQGELIFSSSCASGWARRTRRILELFALEAVRNATSMRP